MREQRRAAIVEAAILHAAGFIGVHGLCAVHDRLQQHFKINIVKHIFYTLICVILRLILTVKSANKPFKLFFLVHKRPPY